MCGQRYGPVMSGTVMLGQARQGYFLTTKKMKETETLEIKSQGWFDLVNEIATKFGEGELIPHEWLFDKFGLKQLRFENFPNQDEFLEAVKSQQFTYMTSVDRLRCELLNEMQICIRNVRGDGYEIIPASDQTQYGYDGFIKDMKKAMRSARAIMNNVASVDAEQQAKDNDLRAKFAHIEQMIKSIK